VASRRKPEDQLGMAMPQAAVTLGRTRLRARSTAEARWPLGTSAMSVHPKLLGGARPAVAA
jgi:hypothetical protein